MKCRVVKELQVNLWVTILSLFHLKSDWHKRLDYIAILQCIACTVYGTWYLFSVTTQNSLSPKIPAQFKCTNLIKLYDKWNLNIKKKISRNNARTELFVFMIMSIIITRYSQSNVENLENLHSWSPTGLLYFQVSWIHTLFRSYTSPHSLGTCPYLITKPCSFNPTAFSYIFLW